MKYRTLGRTGLQVSEIGIGTWCFGGEWGDFDKSEAVRTIRRAAELGVNFVDTAECYGDHLSETIVGQAVKANRDHWVIATKIGHKYLGFLDRIDDYSPGFVKDSIEASLKALDVDVIDLIQFHGWPPDPDDTVAMLERLVEEGKIRFFGASTGGSQAPMDYLHYGKGDTIQIVYNIFTRSPENEAFGYCLENNIGVIPRVPLASGALSGKFTIDTSFPENDHRGRKLVGEKLKQTVAKVDTLRDLVPRGCSMAQFALRYILAQPVVSTIIPGAKTTRQIDDNAAASDMGALDPELVERVNEIVG